MTKTMMTAVIIDDEQRSISVLQNLLTEYCPEVTLAGAANMAQRGVELIRKHRPDIVFLDINMPGLTGFEVLDQFPGATFKVIFTTAYDSHALKAIKYAAVDYLLKPISIEDLRSAIARCAESMSKQAPVAEADKKTNRKYNKIPIPSVHGYDFIDAADIVWVNASESYSIFHMANGNSVTSSSNLKKFEELLDKDTFLRIHHSHIINVDHVKKYVRARNSYVVMSDGAELEISQRRKDVMNSFLRGI